MGPGVAVGVKPMKAVYVMWLSISSLLTLVQTKVAFLEKQFSAPSDEFLDYGLGQILNSILVERI